MRKKISIVLFIIIFGTICVSYIKNKTRDLEKEILKNDFTINDISIKLRDANSKLNDTLHDYNEIKKIIM